MLREPSDRPLAALTLQIWNINVRYHMSEDPKILLSTFMAVPPGQVYTRLAWGPGGRGHTLGCGKLGRQFAESHADVGLRPGRWTHALLASSVDGGSANLSSAGLLHPSEAVQQLTPALPCLGADGFIAGAYQGTIHIIDSRTGEVVDRIEAAHDGEIKCLQWAPVKLTGPQGKVAVLASGGTDGRVRLWRAPWVLV